MNELLPNKIILKSMNESEIFKFLNLKIVNRNQKIYLILNPIDKKHLGGSLANSINGAIIAAICDAGIGATLALLDRPILLGSGVATLDIRMRRPIVGKKLYAVAVIVKKRKNILYSRIEILNDKKESCVVAEGKIYLKKE